MAISRAFFISEQKRLKIDRLKSAAFAEFVYFVVPLHKTILTREYRVIMPQQQKALCTVAY